MAHGTCEADVPLSRCKQSCEVMLLYGNVQASLSPFNFKQLFFLLRLALSDQFPRHHFLPFLFIGLGWEVLVAFQLNVWTIYLKLDF